MTGDQDPGGQLDPWGELKYSLRELHHLSVALTIAVGTDSEAANAITWDSKTYQAADLLEKCLADIGELSGTWLRCSIIDRRGIDPLA